MFQDDLLEDEFDREEEWKVPNVTLEDQPMGDDNEVMRRHSEGIVATATPLSPTGSLPPPSATASQDLEAKSLLVDLRDALRKRREAEEELALNQVRNENVLCAEQFYKLSFAKFHLDNDAEFNPFFYIQ